MKVHIGPYKRRGNKERKIDIRIDDYDVWSADHTLSLIILPTLQKLKETKCSYAFVLHADVPESIRKTEVDFKDNEYSFDENGCFDQEYWNYVLDEMIFAFDSIANYRENDFDLIGADETYIGYNKEEYKKHMERVENGLRLFGKYYRALWD